MRRKCYEFLYVASSFVVAVVALSAMRAPEWCFDVALSLLASYLIEYL
jgi:hypothetical protein